MKKMNIKTRDLRWYLVALGASILYTTIMIQTDISEALLSGATDMNYSFYIGYIIFPLFILYFFGFFVSISIKRDTISWLIIGYTFAYYVCFLFYLATPLGYPPIRIEGIVFLSEFGQRVFWDGIKFVVLPAFIFNTLLFYLLKMKTHLITSIVATISSILVFIFIMQIWMGV